MVWVLVFPLGLSHTLNAEEGEQSLEEALDEIDGDPGRTNEAEALPAPGRNNPGNFFSGNQNVRYIDISLIGDFALGASNLDNEALSALQSGLHDPRSRGFSVTSLELSFSGAVDPYFFAEAHVNLSHGAELEEAFITSQSLPYGLQLEAGQFYTEFGILNAQHPHSWAFLDAPAIHSRIMGDHGMMLSKRMTWQQDKFVDEKFFWDEDDNFIYGDDQAMWIELDKDTLLKTEQEKKLK